MFSKKYLPLFLIILTLSVAALACGFSGEETAPPTATPDMQATVDAAIAATAAAQPPTAVPAPTETALPPSPAPETPVTEETPAAEGEEEYIVMTEEELNAAIEQAVNEAIVAYDDAYVYTEEAASDGELTQEEIDEIYAYYAYADELIALADEYLYLYYDLYADLVYETIDLLNAVEADLNEMEAAMDELIAIVDTAAETIQAGQEVRQETLQAINDNIQENRGKIDQITENWQNWEQTWSSQRDERIQTVQNMQPNVQPGSRAEAINETVKFADAVRNALADTSISHDELLGIAQMSANAIAGLQSQGGPALQSLAGQIGEITGLLAAGNLPAAVDSVTRFESALGSVPGVPSRPQFTPPTLPAAPPLPSGLPHR